MYDVVEEKLENEPDFQYIPEKAPLDSIHQDDHSLRESMVQLAAGLITGTVLTQFDVSNVVWERCLPVFSWLLNCLIYCQLKFIN